MTAHQAPPSLGFSRQDYWSGLPLPSPVLVEGAPKEKLCLFHGIDCCWSLADLGMQQALCSQTMFSQGSQKSRFFHEFTKVFFFFLISRLFSRAALDYKKKKHGKYREFAYTLYLTLTPVSRIINILHWCGTLVATDESILMH